jgi:predicted porin
MKNKILALLATIGLASSVTAVEINEYLSINGFIDGSWQDRSEDHTNTASPISNDTQDVSLDEVELNFLLNVGNVSGEIHLDNQSVATGATDNVNVEQAHFTYTLDNGLSISFGRYGSKLGLEREDPAGLYTFSRAYGDNGAGRNIPAPSRTALNYGDVDTLVRDGVAFGYAAETFAINISLDQTPGDDLKDEGEGINTEFAISYTGIDNLVANVGYRAEQESGTNADTDHINVNATYTMGKALIAAEWQEASNDRTDANNGDNEAYQFIIDYDFTDKLGAAIRYSNEDQDNLSASGFETSKFTIAPNYAITDSLGLIVEYTTADVDSALPTDASDDYDFIAAELTFTF